MEEKNGYLDRRKQSRYIIVLYTALTDFKSHCMQSAAIYSRRPPTQHVYMCRLITRTELHHLYLGSPGDPRRLLC